MRSPKRVKTTSETSGSPVVGIRSDVYERSLELIFMSKDDIDTFETRIGDKQLFQNLALCFLSASIPLGLEKSFDLISQFNAADMGMLILCIGAAALGVIFQAIAWKRRQKIESFKTTLFASERRLSRTFTLVDSSGTPSNLTA